MVVTSERGLGKMEILTQQKLWKYCIFKKFWKYYIKAIGSRWKLPTTLVCENIILTKYKILKNIQVIER